MHDAPFTNSSHLRRFCWYAQWSRGIDLSSREKLMTSSFALLPVCKYGNGNEWQCLDWAAVLEQIACQKLAKGMAASGPEMLVRLPHGQHEYSSVIHGFFENFSKLMQRWVELSQILMWNTNVLVEPPLKIFIWGKSQFYKLHYFFITF